MPRTRARTIWIAKVSSIDREPAQLELLHAGFGDALVAALDPTKHVHHYRDWRVSQPQWDVDKRVLHGTLGYLKRTQQEEVDYDDDRHEWVKTEASTRDGNFAHFRIELDTQLIGFEDRGQDLARDSFLAAMDRFLEPSGLQTVIISNPAGFDEWLTTVDTVTKFRVNLKRPNPGVNRRATEVRDFIAETGADSVRIEATSKAGLHLKDTLLEGAADTASLGNGSYKASALHNGARRFFDSARRVISGVIEVSDSDSSSAIFAKIGDLMDDLRPEMPKSSDHDDD